MQRLVSCARGASPPPPPPEINSAAPLHAAAGQKRNQVVEEAVSGMAGRFLGGGGGGHAPLAQVTPVMQPEVTYPFDMSTVLSAIASQLTSGSSVPRPWYSSLRTLLRISSPLSWSTIRAPVAARRGARQVEVHVHAALGGRPAVRHLGRPAGPRGHQQGELLGRHHQGGGHALADQRQHFLLQPLQAVRGVRQVCTQSRRRQMSRPCRAE